MNERAGEVCPTCVCALFSHLSIHKAQDYVLAICLSPDIHVFFSLVTVFLLQQQMSLDLSNRY